MFKQNFFLTSTALLTLLSALVQPVLAQNNSTLNTNSNFSVAQSRVQGNAALLGPLEVSADFETDVLQTPPVTTIETIELDPELRLAPGLSRDAVGPANDRGVQVKFLDP